MNRIAGFFREHPGSVGALLVALLAFGMRYWFFWNYPYPLMLHEQDGIAYMSIAKDILSLRVPGNLFMPPFYPLVIAFFSVLPVKLEIAARVASITMDALTVLPLYGLSRIVFPRVASLAVCFLWATFGFCLYFAPSPLSQSTYLCMLLSGTYLLYLALTETKKLWLFGLAGFFLSAAYLTRPEGVVALAGGILLIAAGVLRKGSDPMAHLKGGAVFLLIYLAVAFPYLLMLRGQLGFWTFTGKTTVAIKGIDGSLTIESGGRAAKSGLALWLEQFGGVSGGARFILGNISGFFETLKLTFPKWMSYAALVGIPLLLVGRNFYGRLLLLLPLLVTIPVFVANLPKNHSYIYPIYPLYLMSFIAVLWFLGGLAKKIAEMASVPASVAAAAGYFILLAPLPKIALDNFRETTITVTHPEYLHQVNMTNLLIKPAAEDLRRFSGEKDTVMTRWGLVSYFAERPLMTMPKGNVEQVLDAGRKGGVKFIVIDTESVETRRQELAPLLAPLQGKQIDPALGLEVVSLWASDVGGYVLYRYR